MSETFVRQIIIEELEYEPSLDATHIGVAVERGIVTLTGHVASLAQNILSWNSAVPDRAIQVLVRNGWVTLLGDVDWYFQKQSAEEDIRKLSGVRGIVNGVVIKPRVQAIDVKKKIENALRRRLDSEVKGIRVTVQDGGKVILEGSAYNWNKRQAIEAAALSAPGVTAVEDRLSVDTSSRLQKKPRSAHSSANHR